jgi:S-adenosylmethionine:tRNA ribosyltransferase-isomerase
VLVDPSKIYIDDYSYDLPPGRISQYPLEERDNSRLLIYKDGRISQSVFRHLADHLPGGSLMIMNDTRVFHARLLFRKPTGPVVEVFCLEPVRPVREMATAFQQSSPVEWQCLIGHAKRWKSGWLTSSFDFNGEACTLSAMRMSAEGENNVVRLSWHPSALTFSQVVEACGKMPLPPYITRQAEPSDEVRYQTIYARQEGSVAAPTAGLHYTEEVMRSLASKNILMTDITLHVGAGTFKPVTQHTISNHQMHREHIEVPVRVLKLLAERSPEEIIAVGDVQKIEINQWEPYEYDRQVEVPVKEALYAVMDHCRKNDMDLVEGYTRLMIIPGYHYRMPGIMITNFHLPRSTLLLLVAAFIGDDWKRAYQYALKNGFRFLSYGDSCLFYRKR